MNLMGGVWLLTQILKGCKRTSRFLTAMGRLKYIAVPFADAP